MSFLVDSDIWIDAFNGQDDAIQLLSHRRSDGLAISIISLGEIYDGVLGSTDPAPRLRDTDAFLRPYPILSLDRPVMLQFAELRMRLRAVGQLIPDFDLLIASTALVHNLTLITENRRHFERVPGLTLSGYR